MTTQSRSSNPHLSAECLDWITEFRDRHGRAPRILHVGNIANNAFRNAILLNEVGLDCDVICYDYYHLMGCPEWEEADFEGRICDQFRPDWTKTNLKGYERPRWFVQGPLDTCINYLIARRGGKSEEADSYWEQLAVANNTLDRSLRRETDFASRLTGKITTAVRQMWRYLKLLTWDREVATKIAMRAQASFNIAKPIGNISSLILMMALLLVTLLLRLSIFPYWMLRKSFSEPADAFDETQARLMGEFATAYPDRNDRLSAQDLEPYRYVSARWIDLFQYYDIIQAYATDPILPMLAGKHPYIGFEHGTLRTFTLGDSAVCRLTSLAYNKADHVFITNGDCLEYAKKIGVIRYSPMLHPVGERRIREAPGDYARIHAEFGAKYVFLCTLRHDWAIKGTDKYILALPRLKEALGPCFIVLMTKWGNQLSGSLQLARELGVESLVRWIEPLPKLKLVRLQKSVDVLFDQIALPHFGATAPEGIAAGVPVIMSYDPNSTAWIVGEPAPILSAWTIDDIVRNVQLAIDQEWLSSYRKHATEWIDRYHNDSIVLERHLVAYRRLIAPLKPTSHIHGP